MPSTQQVDPLQVGWRLHNNFSFKLPSRMGKKNFKLSVGPSEKSPVPFITFLPPVRFATTAQLSQSVCPVIANRSRPPIENVERRSVAVAVHASSQSVEDLWLALYLRML